MPSTMTPAHSSQKSRAMMAHAHRTAPSTAHTAPVVNPARRLVCFIRNESGTAVSAEPMKYIVTGSVASVLSAASAKPASALIEISIALLVWSRPWQPASTATFFRAGSTTPSALLELHFAEHDLPCLVAVRRLVGGLHVGEHLQGALHGGTGVDPVEPALDVGIFRDIDAAGIGAAQPGKARDVGDRVFAPREIARLPQLLVHH